MIWEMQELPSTVSQIEGVLEGRAWAGYSRLSQSTWRLDESHGKVD